MSDKYYGIISSLLMGIVLIIMSVIMLIWKGQFYLASVNFIIFVFFIKFIFDLYELVKKKNSKVIITSIFHFGTCLFFYLVPNFFYGLAPVLFSIYLCLIGISQFVMCFLEIKNGDFINFRQLFIVMVCLSIAFSIFINPVMKLDRFVILVAIYMLLLGGYYLYDLIPKKAKNNIKRRIRITLPKIVEAIIPYSVMVEINRNLEVMETNSYVFDETNMDSDLSILIHTSNRGFNRMGHMDIYFEGKVISYGNYDEGSRFFKDSFGDGVLFVVKNKDAYINFCIDNSKKTIFEFGIKLTSEQKRRVKNRVDELISNTVKWNYKDDSKYDSGASYAAKLYKKTKAKFYKFKKGKYKTYYILGTNCCYLVDDILGKSGMDILSINGIITPGTYYDYLNRRLKLRNSNIISKDIYNSNYKAKENN